MIRKGFLLLGIVSLSFFTSCKDDASKKVNPENVEIAAQRDEAAQNFAEISFDKKEHDFGTINEGDQVETVFKFKNTGKSPLIISNIKGSCGCTVPNDWPRDPIAPGADGQFTVKYNSTNKPNKKTNTVTVTANTKAGRETVKITAFATPDPEKEAQRAKQKAEREKRRAEQQAKQAAQGGKKDSHEGHNH